MKLPARALAPLWAIALSMPALPAQGRVVEVAMCNGGTQRIVLPANDGSRPADDPHQCCHKACHAGSERRKKAGVLCDSGC